jgi:hypothetical protein
MEARSRFAVLVFLFTFNTYADVMNLNEFMPTRLEDATPTDLHKFEIQFGSQFEEKSQDEVNFRTNARYGLTDRIQLEGMMNTLSGGDEANTGDIQLGGQYLINKNAKYVPEVAFSPGITIPSGRGSQGIDSHLRFNISSTIIGSPNTPTTQIHLNIDWGDNQSRQSQERRNRLLYVMGLSHRFSDSGSVIVDFFREEEMESMEETNMFELGTEYDLGSSYYAGLGAGVGLGDESPSWHGIFSLEKQI